MLRWARERAGRSLESLADKFPRLADWEAGQAQPTLKQLEQYARATYVPFGYFFLPVPPKEPLPIADLRTIDSERLGQVSPDLRDTLYLCQQRQTWYRDWARVNGEPRRDFVGSARLSDSPADVAGQMRAALAFDLEARRRSSTWEDALRLFVAQADRLGVLVMISGVVGSNNHRKLDPTEFRGFALVDDLAPLVFINGADTKSAQMFTLAHELAHLWLGESALSDVSLVTDPGRQIEAWCNQVAAELLVPLAALRQDLTADDPLAQVQRLARYFKVSKLVLLRRLLDLGRLTRQAFRAAYDQELEKLAAVPRGSGGDFYLTQSARLSKRFAQALVLSTLEGQTLYRDAYKLLGVSKDATFRELGRSLELPV
jgi:Zn-dependent peptidase ImmA (M78 family)